MIANRFPIATKRLLLPLVEPEDLTTHVPYLLDGVTDQNSGGTALDDLPLLGLNLPSGGSVPYAQHLVQNQNIPAPPGWRWKRPAGRLFIPMDSDLKGRSWKSWSSANLLICPYISSMNFRVYPNMAPRR